MMAAQLCALPVEKQHKFLSNYSLEELTNLLSFYEKLENEQVLMMIRDAIWKRSNA